MSIKREPITYDFIFFLPVHNCDMEIYKGMVLILSLFYFFIEMKKKIDVSNLETFFVVVDSFLLFHATKN